ncbi:MAG: Hydrogenase maturation factor [Candidatus Daviesbacteria bacterium GW2011_GWA1_41_61]|uniref:Hydrogenase maturation factor n=1 Tax=Candidatus Daviesbacteria bacterium GW2011_GWA2_40_9 TaxID=1618424 RepID=A0A0G0U010_9BACT|nr:MAG: Hydrogenase maturation factor [Candidatus Daviesbacteria bacterium GW2011_GWC1_40_9]KKR82489.1 MAG: Hydrogenase maturation factor [Candidatus Daviesbacteria bacterium GW2011_GWA2_40_9]KKR93152.1 MAG: Hydrogenase maturation factor [Candidatus Daviesbacteria bacterium GW2011_GWB1_41_15]KKS15696.1 MAG: Hydrogenase maturation factor [Candidatus Daviesbacteria bacterium GW2011_GWA1_41_61]
MCLAIPGKIIKVEKRQVLVQYPGQTRLALVGDEAVKVGDWVLVQMGIVIKILSSKEAQIAQKSWIKFDKR